MKVYEKIKEMSFKEMADFLECLDIDADNIYCRFLCPFASGECDELDDDDMPCKSVNVVHEFLNSECDENLLYHLAKKLKNVNMFNVYEVYTWDDVNFTKISSHDNEQDAKTECDKLNAERRSHNYDLDPICYCVMSDLQYSLMMEN